MSDIKKLFKRDRFYWRIMTVIMAIVVIYMMTNVSGLYHHKFFHLEDYLARTEWLRNFWDLNPEYMRASWDDHPQLHYQDGIYLDEISNQFLNHMTLVTVIVVLIAQAVKLLVQETKNRTEVLRIFPVKSRNLLSYHYLSGLFTIGILLLIQIALIRLDILYLEKNTDFIFTNKEDLWSYAGSALNVFMLPYSLFLFCKKVTNNVPGTILTFILTFLFAGLAYWYCLNECDWVLTYVFIASSMAVLILLSYIADQKKGLCKKRILCFSYRALDGNGYRICRNIFPVPWHMFNSYSDCSLRVDYRWRAFYREAEKNIKEWG